MEIAIRVLNIFPPCNNNLVNHSARIRKGSSDDFMFSNKYQ